MNKFALVAVALSTALTAQAGGYLTNTNQSVVFLRNPARNAAIGIDGAYTNPAGIGFMPKGWHFSLNLQSAYQTRDIHSTFGPLTEGGPYPFNLGVINGTPNPFHENGVRMFKGKAKAPVIPSIDVARVWDRFSLSAHFGITGGGGKCEFDNGLGLFESQVALVPSVMNALMPGAATGYSADTYVRGRQYYWGGQLNFGYKIHSKLNVSAGLRVVYASCNYYGYVRNISAIVGGTPQNAAALMTGMGMPHLAAIAADRNLNCDQSGWGVTPVLGIDWKSGKWNLAARWEMKTRLRLKNRSGENTSGLSEYDDGKSIPADLPSIVSLGAQYEILPNLRANVGAHFYADKKATQYEHHENLLQGNGWEVLAGMEWDINKRFTVSAGAQSTNYGLGKNSKFLTNISFVTNSYSLGFGGKVNLSDKVALNVAYFKTFYKPYKKRMTDYNNLKATMGAQVKQLSDMLTEMKNNSQNGQAELNTINKELGAISQIAPQIGAMNTAGTDLFKRTNDVFGVSLDISF